MSMLLRLFNSPAKRKVVSGLKMLIKTHLVLDRGKLVLQKN